MHRSRDLGIFPSKRPTLASLFVFLSQQRPLTTYQWWQRTLRPHSVGTRPRISPWSALRKEGNQLRRWVLLLDTAHCSTTGDLPLQSTDPTCLQKGGGNILLLGFFFFFLFLYKENTKPNSTSRGRGKKSSLVQKIESCTRKAKPLDLEGRKKPAACSFFFDSHCSFPYSGCCHCVDGWLISSNNSACLYFAAVSLSPRATGGALVFIRCRVTPRDQHPRTPELIPVSGPPHEHVCAIDCRGRWRCYSFYLHFKRHADLF